MRNVCYKNEVYNSKYSLITFWYPHQSSMPAWSENEGFT